MVNSRSVNTLILKKNIFKGTKMMYKDQAIPFKCFLGNEILINILYVNPINEIVIKWNSH
jgi:hypothetical protein